MHSKHFESVGGLYHIKASFYNCFLIHRVKRVCFKTLVDEVQELEALSKDPGAVVHGKRYSYTPIHYHTSLYHEFRCDIFTFVDLL